LAAIVGTVANDCARAEPGFPARPIRISIPFGAGGVADLTMRLLAQTLTE
jgi:tripartite-type tricarboxylate transporter receptor subunit TctC